MASLFPFAAFYSCYFLIGFEHISSTAKLRSPKSQPQPQQMSNFTSLEITFSHTAYTTAVLAGCYTFYRNGISYDAFSLPVQRIKRQECPIFEGIDNIALTSNRSMRLRLYMQVERSYLTRVWGTWFYNLTVKRFQITRVTEVDLEHETVVIILMRGGFVTVLYRRLCCSHRYRRSTPHRNIEEIFNRHEIYLRWQKIHIAIYLFGWNCEAQDYDAVAIDPWTATVRRWTSEGIESDWLNPF